MGRVGLAFIEADPNWIETGSGRVGFPWHGFGDKLAFGIIH